MRSDAGADKGIADQGDATPLPVASESGHLEVVRLLSDAGADKDIAMQGGATPLLVASQQGHLVPLARRISDWTPLSGLFAL